MFALYLAVTFLSVIANSYAAILDFMQTEQTVTNAITVGASRSWVVPLGALKAAGAAGLLVGIAIPLIGVAAAVGLVAFFACAIGAHVRVGWFSTIPFPAIFLVLAAGTLALRLATT
ncbi:DoxX family protein [Prescottella agglutinans]|uniref:DoxX family protein n=1 Tax=Prescottella agglutinans TaxID=1644129 RepID=A0A3S3AIG9_9NOCA|nr:DoxX family protein [Prescottella agglutinans]